MTRQAESRFVVIMTLMGGKDDARITFETFDSEVVHNSSRVYAEVFSIPMDGEDYSAAEWLKEVLAATVEKL